MKKNLILIFVLLSALGFAQKDTVKAPYADPETGHEIELFGGYSFYSPGYTPSNSEWIALVTNKHVIKYGLGYTYKWKRLRHQFYVNSYAVDYDYNRRIGDSFGWIEHEGVVHQQWLEIGGFGGFKLFDSLNVNLYPCLGFSFGIPVSGYNVGERSAGIYSTTEEYEQYDYNKAPSKIFNLRLGLMYNFELSDKLGLNTYLFYSRSLVHPDLLGDNNNSLTKIHVNQLVFNLGIYYFIKSKRNE